MTSQYLFTGIRLTLGVLLPCMIMVHYGMLSQMIAFPLGTLFVGLVDNPGPYIHRRNTLLASIAIYFVLACITGLLRSYPWVIFIEIVAYGMFFSLISVYGTRIGAIGTIALLVFVFNIDDHLSGPRIFHSAFYFTAGGIWYFILFIFLHTIRPYVLIRQLLGECFIDTGKFLNIKSKFYFRHPDYDSLSKELISYQGALSKHHEDLREIIFKTRQIASESTVRSRIFMLMYLDCVELLERVMNAQQDYRKLQKAFGDSRILILFGMYIALLAREMEAIGIAVQSGRTSRSEKDLDVSLKKCVDAFYNYRATHISADNVEDFIMLRQILYSLQDITERVKKLHRATTFDKTLTRDATIDLDKEADILHSELNPRLLLDNISLKSNYFRMAVRLTTALLIGYIISFFFPIGHNYWILLTIVTLIKPSYSITKERNIHRLFGTIAGIIVGFTIIYFIKNHTALFILMMMSMIVAYAFLKLNYFVATFGVTLYVLISSYFLAPGAFNMVLKDRILDTIIGSLIAWVVSVSVLPYWEHLQIRGYIMTALKRNWNYFKVSTGPFTGNGLDMILLKKTRKEALIALGNLSDVFQRMLSDPKSQQPHMEEYHQFVATSQQLTSYIASLSNYAQDTGTRYSSESFNQIIGHINTQFLNAEKVLNNESVVEMDSGNRALPENTELQELLNIRKKQIRQTKELNTQNSTIRKTLSDMKTINGLFELVNTIAVDEIKILQKIKK